MAVNVLRACRNHNLKAALKAVKADLQNKKDIKTLAPKYAVNLSDFDGSRNTFLREALAEYGFTVVSGEKNFCTAEGVEKLLHIFKEWGIDENVKLIYTDELKGYVNIRPDEKDAPVSDNMAIKKIYPEEILFKPDYSPEALEDYNYIGDFYIVDSELYHQCMKPGMDSHEFLKCISAILKANQVVHIADPVVFTNTKEKRKNYPLIKKVEDMQEENTRNILKNAKDEKNKKYKQSISDASLVSIIIPNHNHRKDLERLVDSVFSKTDYPNYEIIIVENNSTDKDLFVYYDSLKKEHDNVRIIVKNEKFNYSAFNNAAVRETEGEYILLLNNDMKIITSCWISSMLDYANRPEIGAVGACLLYPDDTVQHAGVIVGIGPDGTAVHPNSGVPYEFAGYRDSIHHVQNYSAVTGACLLVEKKKYIEVGGLDEKLAVAYNDIDFCLKLLHNGYRNVYVPEAVLYHYESLSRGLDSTGDNNNRFKQECLLFKEKWADRLENDPYYNKNLSRSIPWRLLK